MSPQIRLALIIALLAGLPQCSRVAQAADVLVYNSFPSGELAWYSGYGSLVINSVDEATWSGMSTAQFASYDLIFIGASTGASAGYSTLYSTRATWQPAVTGNIVVHTLDPAAHSLPGAMTFADATIGWALGGGGTALMVGSDIGIVGFNFLDAWGITGCMGFNCFAQDTVTVTMPSHASMVGVTSSSLSNWGWSSHNQVTAYDPSFLVTAVGPGSEALVLVREAGPSCAFTSPPMGSVVTGPVLLGFDVDHATSLPVDLLFEFSTDSGTTFASMTAEVTSILPNPAVGVSTPLVGGSFTWNSVADGVGFVTPTTTIVRITADDGSVAVPCSTSLDVDNVVPPPTCALMLPPAPLRGDAIVSVDTASTSSATVDILVEFSTDAGATYVAATMSGLSTNPNPALGLPLGASDFLWDFRADGIGLLALEVGVIVRATVDDGVAPLAGECSTLTDIDNTMICFGICGDCNLNASGPDVVDALTAAQIAVALIVPTTVQVACCDVNSSGVVDIVDSLFIAQTAAGLPASLVCM